MQRFDANGYLVDVCELCDKGWEHGVVKYAPSVGKYICNTCRKNVTGKNHTSRETDWIIRNLNLMSTRTIRELKSNRHTKMFR